ncbi:hypothetical protein COY62_03150 [bacterium (Candidatus Howlettbacteria) CG_4_10_14_0_8_um_filter_40_9]|nr:MAG: hypothetical protein COY62_03150 [bacterium (Candidatus Howlettbacteria) CG_4_10_14_0_8_um_filter_40_9]
MYPAAMVAGAVLVSIFIGFFIIKTQYNTGVKLSSDIKSKEENLQKLETKLTKLQELKSKEVELIQKKDRVLAALPQDQDVSRLFVEVEKMISDTGAFVESAKEGSGVQTASSATSATNVNMPGIKNYSYDINFTTSTYESIKNSLDNMEKALRLVNLDSFKIGADASGNGFKVTFGMKTYSREEASK